ncbi:hypothetical protein C8Q69DRAFT_447521 [Paecilomyces variotii]|uniref:Secreted protein n=1 Tax=Byssochlamys spectabilis TaxID=264951 RepID=A0A443HKK5_BYSSP|nr:hypothetical protein C8Q69DRAFT_447521 [Paecilomyces variotii]RWQ92327.1 hypothetical protein C8Q69DRAFT_447521 [Paecilomyces variotii]
MPFWWSQWGKHAFFHSALLFSSVPYVRVIEAAWRRHACAAGMGFLPQSQASRNVSSHRNLDFSSQQRHHHLDSRGIPASWREFIRIFNIRRHPPESRSIDSQGSSPGDGVRVISL